MAGAMSKMMTENAKTMNSMLDGLTRQEREMAYSGSPVNLWVRRLWKRIAKAEREEDAEYERRKISPAPK